jgi:hypothetical protein
MELMRRRTFVCESDARQNPRIAGDTCRSAFGVANRATGRRANIFLISERCWVSISFAVRFANALKDRSGTQALPRGSGSPRGGLERYKREAQHR